MGEIVIKLEDVWKVYYLGKIAVWALKGINLEVEKGNFLSIIGPSGSGKSTLLQIMGCLELPTKGKVFLEGNDIQNFSEDKLARVRGKKIGFIFQQFNLLNDLTALENVALPMIFQGCSEYKRIQRAKEILTMVGLEKRMNHRPQELSGGEQQRVAIARALANDPEIIIADEPTGNLDLKSGQMIMEILKNLHQKEKKTILVVTHDQQIASYSEKILSIVDGKLIKK